MKKLFITMVVALMSTAMSVAQNTLVATLSHGEDIIMYYGTYALRDAHNAAANGDIINLSGGSFQAVNITKAIAIRGTGIDDANPTYLVNDFQINIPSDAIGRLSMEGICCKNKIDIKGNLNNAYFLKCKLYGFDYPESSIGSNIMYINCKITNHCWMRGKCTLQFVNSYIYDYYNNSTNTSASFINCVVIASNDGREIQCSLLTNCIICKGLSRTYSFNYPTTTSFNKCWFINYSGTNPKSYADFFMDYTGTYSDSQTFELTDEAKTTYLGTDGTQVGIYGGILPYDSTPSYPQITKMNVANKTTADGKLSVEIEVSAVQ